MRRRLSNVLLTQKRCDDPIDDDPTERPRTLYVSGQLTLEQLERVLDIVLRFEAQRYA